MKTKIAMAVLALTAAGITAWAVADGAPTEGVLVRLGATFLFLAVGLVLPAGARFEIDEDEDLEPVETLRPRRTWREPLRMAAGGESFTWEPQRNRIDSLEEGPRQF